MKKPGALRETLTAALAHIDVLATDPDRLLMTAVDWRPVADARPGSSLQVSYTLELVFLDFPGDPMQITIPLLIWLYRHQHDMFASPEEFQRRCNGTFELLEHGKFDANIKLQLTERARYQAAAGGGFDVTYLDEPPPFAMEDADAALHAVIANGAQILHCTAHPDAGL